MTANRSSGRGRFATVVLALARVVLLSPSVLAAQELRIRFLNVGQGDGTLIATPEGRQVLIDAGPNRHAVAAFLAVEGIDTLDLVVASHAHADHIGGMAEVLRAAVVRFYMDNGMPHSTATYQRTLAALTASGAQYLEASSRTLTVGSIRFRVLAPPAAARDQNDASVGVLLQFGGFRALFTGDSELGELQHWLTHDSIPAVQVLKVAHHGSRNGSSPSWAEATRPALAVVPVGARNRYGHPSAGIVTLWSAVGTTVVRTRPARHHRGSGRLDRAIHRLDGSGYLAVRLPSYCASLMAGTLVYWAIDRIEGKVAVLERDDGSTVEALRRALPKGAREGSVLLVAETAKGEPDWTTAVLDEAERERPVKRAEEALERLRRGDPGGDIVIS